MGLERCLPGGLFWVILWGFLGGLLLCGVGIICRFLISGCFAWMMMRVSFDCGRGGCAPGCGVVLSRLVVTRLVWVWDSVCRGFSILGGLGGFLVGFSVWGVICFCVFLGGLVRWWCRFPG